MCLNVHLFYRCTELSSENFLLITIMSIQERTPTATSASLKAAVLTAQPSGTVLELYSKMELSSGEVTATVTATGATEAMEALVAVLTDLVMTTSGKEVVEITGATSLETTGTRFLALE